MAVEETTNTEDTSVSEDTSTNEELETDDVSLEDMDISLEEDTDETDSDEGSEEDGRPTDNQNDDDSEDDDQEEEDTEEVSDDSGNDEEPAKEEPKSQQEIAREAYKAREEARQARQQLEAERRQNEEANLQRYLQEAEDDQDELIRRQNEVAAYRMKEERIVLNTERLETGLQRAVADIPLFKNGTEAVQKRLLRAADNFEATYVQKDEKGRPVQINGDVYQYLKAEADSIQELLGDGARQQGKDKSNQKSRTLTRPSRVPKKAKVDPDLADFDAAVERGY